MYMTKNIDVSVIIPTFGRPKYLERAIMSVLNQTNVHFEIIVVDDNNPNSENRNLTEKTISKFMNEKNLKYVKHSKNMNGAAARNTGIMEAEGRYISFLDDDDIYLPDRLKRCMDYLDNNSLYDAVYTGCIALNCKRVKTVFSYKEKGNLSKELLALNDYFGSGSNIFVRKEIATCLHGFDEKFLRHQDFEFMVRFFKFYKTGHIDDILLVKFVEDKSNVPNTSKMFVIRNQYYEKFKQEIDQFAFNDIFNNAYLDIYCSTLKNGDVQTREMIKLFLKQHSLFNCNYKKKLILSYLINYTIIGRIYYCIKDIFYKKRILM